MVINQKVFSVSNSCLWKISSMVSSTDLVVETVMDLVVEKEMGLAVETEIGVAVDDEKVWMAPLQP